MNTQKLVSLHDFTSLGCGGVADELIEVANAEELLEVLKNIDQSQKLTILGYGTNIYVADAGLRGLTVVTHGGKIEFLGDSGVIVADAGVWWDDLVAASIDKGLWGLELMSGIPGGIGGAVVGNIAAYGEAVADTVVWVEVFARDDGKVKRLLANELHFGYRQSVLQHTPQSIVLRAAFQLSNSRTKEVKYQGALDYARENQLDLDTLQNTRAVILGHREQAVSLYDWRSRDKQVKSAGSFFKNPLVPAGLAEQIISFEEADRTMEQVKASNMVHGGDARRVSAAQVLLAAGFTRGQQWGGVRLHPSHILKLENTGAATAEDILAVRDLITQKVEQVFGITLESEVKYLS